MTKKEKQYLDTMMRIFEGMYEGIDGEAGVMYLTKIKSN